MTFSLGYHVVSINSSWSLFLVEITPNHMSSVYYFFLEPILCYNHKTFKIWSLGSTRYIHNIKDDPVSKVSSQEPSMSSQYPSFLLLF